MSYSSIHSTLALIRTTESSPSSLDDFLFQELQLHEPNHWEHGLSDSQVRQRIQTYGKNEVPTKKPKELYQLFLDQFNDRLVQVLLFVAMVSAAASFSEAQEDMRMATTTVTATATKMTMMIQEGNHPMEYFMEPIIILSILILNATVGVWQQLSAIKSLDALKQMQPKLATVLRKDEATGISDWISGYRASDLVPGDVIQIRVGEFVPADVCLAQMDSNILTIDESALTGESESVIKIPFHELEEDHSSDKQSAVMAFSGTIVTAGTAVAIVLRTGSETKLGRIQSSMDAVEDEKTPLTQKLDKFADDLAKIIAIICAAVFLISIPRFDDPSFSSIFEGAFYYAKVGVALGVAAIPEGLPAVITLVLALGTRRLAEKNVIVRNLPSVETLGSVSVICTDKTGTLTTNQMTAVSLVVAESTNASDFGLIEHSIEGSTYEPLGKVGGIDSQEIMIHPTGAIADTVAVSIGCNNAILSKKDDTYVVVGEPTEGALLTLAEKIGNLGKFKADIDSTAAVWKKQYERYATLDFDRIRKSMSVLYRSTDGGNESCYRLLVKGAPNLLLKRCSKIKSRSGVISTLTEDMRTELQECIRNLSSRPLRCLLLAVKDIGQVDSKKLERSNVTSDIESDLTLVSLIGIKDPPREDARNSIELCRRAGIRIIMITGDSRDTAVAIARDLNILSDGLNAKAFEGKEFFLKSRQEQLNLLKDGNLVFCRTEPSDKQTIVKLLQDLDEIPAMCGDGVNDALVLRQSSIGIAMGSGTDVAKEAADMILVDNSFSTIVDGIQEGRGIYMNMLSFIDFLISCNVGEVLAVFICTLLGFPSILSAIQLLWVNLVTDGPPATALGFNPSENVMQDSPRPRDEGIITPWLLVRYCVIGGYIGIATVGIFASYFINLGLSIDDIRNWSLCEANISSIGCNVFTDKESLSMPQTLALSTLITSELIKALSSVSLDSSILSVGPQRNPYLILGVFVPFIIHLGIVYSSTFGMPWICESFGLTPLSVESWASILIWSIPVIFIDEALKIVSRTQRRTESRRSQ